MADVKTAVVNTPVWVDLASKDPEGSRQFYAKLFGWNIEVDPDPQYGGYGVAKVDGRDVAGIGPVQGEGAPTAWSIYIGTADADALAESVQKAGGTVVAPPFAVGELGRMAVFQDPSGAFISAWQASSMPGFGPQGAGRFGWAELHARGIEKAIPFYQSVFGWAIKQSEMGEGMTYYEFQVDGQSIAGGMEMNAMVPAQVPSYWLVYFAVDQVDTTFEQAKAAGATELVAPQDFPGGRFAMLTDPQGAAFGLLKMREG
jgi:uncharacterized protein